MPDVINTLILDKHRLPKGIYHEPGFVTRQVIYILVERGATEYRTQILRDENVQCLWQSTEKNIRRFSFNGRRLYVLFNPLIFIDFP